MNKKLLAFIFIFTFILALAPMVDAAKIDYSPNEKGIENMKAHVKDTILFGLINIGEQGTMELKSHKSPTHVLEVGAGWQVTMIYETNFGEAHQGILGNVSFIDMRTGEEVQRDHKIVYWGEETRERDICLTYETLTTYGADKPYQECTQKGEENYTYEGWLDYNSKDIPKGKITLGLMTYVIPGDYVDGIWEVQGKKIDKHASWTSGLNVDLESYYKLDNSSGVVYDMIRVNDGTNNGATRGVTGLINDAFSFDGINDYVSLGNINEQQLTFNAWVKGWTATDDITIASKWIGTLADGNWILWYDGGVVKLLVRESGSWQTLTATIPSSSQWNMITWKYDGSTLSLIVNDGTPQTTSWSGSIASNTDIIELGRAEQNGWYWDGDIDEVGIWSRALSSEEIAQLYNSGDGISYVNTSASAINLLYPAADATLNNLNVEFSANVSGGTPLNVSLIVDDVYEQTNTSGDLGVYNFSETLTEGLHSWNVESCTASSCTNGTARNFTIDTTPFIQYENPTPVNNSNLTNPYIPVNVSLTETYFKNVTFNFYREGVLNESITFTDGTRFYNKTDCTGDNWSINVTTCTTTNKCNSTETRLINIDLLPPEIEISAPSGVINYLVVGESLDLNFTATDYVAGLDSCWYDYNGTNTPISCTNATLVSTQFTQEASNFNLTVYANDSFGNIGSNFTSWNFKLHELNITFNNETTEGSYEKYYLYLKKAAGINIQSAILYYNGETDIASIYSSGDEITLLSELIVPSVTGLTNETFYFTINLDDGSSFNSTNRTQVVNDISVDDCSSNPYPFLYLYLKDEETKNALLGTIETNIEIINNFNYAQVLNISQEETNVSFADICSSVELNQTNFLINAEIRYSSENHSKEFYHIQRGDLTQYPANISLFDLETDDTTKFKILYRDQDLLGVEGAIVQLQRKYISEGIFEVVEAPVTSSESTTILHIDTETNKYQITVVKNGEILGLFQDLAFVCQSELTGECTLDLFDKLTPPNLISLSNLEDFSSAYESSIDNKTITLTYTIPSGSAEEVRVIATQEDPILGNSTICNQSVISSAGSIECTYSTSIQDSKIDYKVYKNGELVATRGFIAQEDLRDDWGGVNYFLIIILLLSVSFMALSSPEWIVINAVLTVLIGGGIWLIRGIGFVEGLGSLMWLVISAVILISKLSGQEDR